MTTHAGRAATIMERCDVLATFTTEDGRITRPYGTPALAASRQQVAEWMALAGMATRVDQVGNLFGRYEGAEPGAKAFLIGGHIDSVVNAGRYDGILGVLTGIAAVESLRDVGTRLPFAIEVIAFADEEGNRFSTSFLGSSPAAGMWNPAWMALTDADGISLGEAILGFGGDPGAIAGDALDPESLLGFIEVHIEQGPVLQDRNLPVAVVSAITGAARAEIALTGQAGHAGTVPMGMRRDALAGAAEVILAIEAVGREHDGFVATVGTLSVDPGATNVIPGGVTMSLDLRHPDPAVRAAAVREIQARVAGIAVGRSLELDWTDLPGFAETTCDAALSRALEDAIRAEGVAPVRIFSGAGHDAIPMSRITPVSMMFVRCRDGISHNPLESIVINDVEVALRVLERFLQSIAGGEG
ncbi:MAG TPA: allantoate amidohydrolase [Thermomicrobiales bacterium]|nr:allantoate amidohydrolase [Thermomicrobiales bacterium]